MRSKKSKSLVLIVVGLLIVFSFFFFNTPHRKVQPKPFNILWLTAESMQPGHLGAYGYHRNTSPNIDTFAKTGVLFKWNFNVSAWTIESMVSNLLGVYSPRHGVDTRDKFVPSGWYTPLEILSDYGYKIPRLQGFMNIQNFNFVGLTNDGSPDNLISWLKNHKDQRFFVWYHLLQTHLPYSPPEEHKKLFWKKGLIKNPESKKRIDEVMTSSIIIRGKTHFKKADDLEAIHALYDGAIHYMDSEFGKIMKTLDDLGLRENTIVIFSADHGEELLEHGFIGHASTAKGGTLYDEITHVPLIISFPKALPQGKVINTIVRGIDIMPTVFDLLGFLKERFFQGQSLLALIENPEKAKDRMAFASSSYKGFQEEDPKNVRDYMRAVRSKDWKLIYHLWDLKDEEFYLYDLKQDPEELTDVSKEHPKKLKEMKDRLFSTLDQTKKLRMRLESSKESMWQRLRAWWADKMTSDETKELIAKAPQAPKILLPKEREVLSYATTNGNLLLTWEGLEGVPYLVQILAGEGDKKIDLKVKADEPKVSHEISEAFWNEYAVLYPKVKVRVKINRRGFNWGPWTNFEIR